MDHQMYLRPRGRGMDPSTKQRFERTILGGAVLIALGLWGVSALFGAPAGGQTPVGAAASARAIPATSAPAAAIATRSPVPAATAGTESPSASPAASSAAPASNKPARKATPVATASTETTAKVSDFVVVIDAGHQAHADLRPEPIGPGSKKTKPSVAGGTSGVVTHARESAVNLAVALRLRKALEARGIRVIMVRTKQKVDIPNSKRAKMANAAHAGLLIRLHCDGAGSSSVKGLLTLVPARNSWTQPIVTVSARAGRDIRAAAIKATGAKDRGITRRGDMSGFNWSKVPAVIVEMGVMTNRADDRKLSQASYQQKLADGMAAGIALFATGK
jgi:N-acetylmuramoyl-L-alanine amidase